jgi:hypothetical protein
MKTKTLYRFSTYNKDGTPKPYQKVPSLKRIRELVKAKGRDACRYEINITNDNFVTVNFSEQKGNKQMRAFGNLEGGVEFAINGIQVDMTVARGRWECGKTPAMNFLDIKTVRVRNTVGSGFSDVLSAELR